jgi:O-antigen ligase
MIFVAGLIATIVATFQLLVAPLNGVLSTLMVKSLIDATWDKGFLGMNCIKVLSVAVPLLVIPRIIFSKTRRFFDMELSGVAVAIFVSSIIGVTGLVAAGKFQDSIDYFFRVLSGFLGFVLFQYYFDDRENFRRLVLALLLAGLFPVFIGLFQALTGTMWRVEKTSLGMVRNVGMYHDAFTVRYYGYQTLSAILLYWSYFTSGRPMMRLTLFMYACATSFVIFKGYSKTGMSIFAVWAIIWAVFSRKFHWLIVIVAAVAALNLMTDDSITKDTERVFMKEMGAYQGTMDNRYILAGRTVIWEMAWKKWNDLDAFFKIFGSGANPPVHNEYLRLLICNGIIGLLVFGVSLLIITVRVLVNVFGRASPLNITALMALSMLIIDTLGLHTGLYPAYQWYIYGFVTLALGGVKGLDEQCEEERPEEKPVSTGSVNNNAYTICR